jgi:hypothetical protein
MVAQGGTRHHKDIFAACRSTRRHNAARRRESSSLRGARSELSDYTLHGSGESVNFKARILRKRNSIVFATAYVWASGTVELARTEFLEAHWYCDHKLTRQISLLETLIGPPCVHADCRKVFRLVSPHLARKGIANECTWNRQASQCCSDCGFPRRGRSGRVSAKAESTLSSSVSFTFTSGLHSLRCAYLWVHT